MSDFLTREEAVEAYGSTSLIYLVYNIPREGYPEDFEFHYRAEEFHEPWRGRCLYSSEDRKFIYGPAKDYLESSETQPSKIVVREFLGNPVHHNEGNFEWLFQGVEERRLASSAEFGITEGGSRSYICYGQTIYNDRDEAVAKAERISAEIWGDIPVEKQLLGDDFRFPNPGYTQQGQTGYLATSDLLDPNGIQKFDVNVNFALFVQQKVPTSGEVSYGLLVKSCEEQNDSDHAVLILEKLNGEWQNRESVEAVSKINAQYIRTPTVYAFPDGESRDEYVAQISQTLFQQAAPHLSDEALLEELKQRGIEPNTSEFNF